MRFLILTILVGGFCPGYSQSYQQVAGFSYVEKVTGSSAELPVIIAFHFSSSKPIDAIAEYDSLKVPVRIIAPRGNFRKRDGYSYFPADYYTKDSLTQMTLSRQTLDSIAVFVKAIGEKYKTKPIVAGFSQGGDLSFLLAVYYPGLIQAAFPFAGFIHHQRWDDATKHAQKSVPIYIYQGDADKIVAVDFSRKEVAALKPYFAISITTYPGLGHDFSPAMMRDYADAMRRIIRQK